MSAWSSRSRTTVSGAALRTSRVANVRRRSWKRRSLIPAHRHAALNPRLLVENLREVAYKLVDIGFSKEAAIETMNHQTLVVLQEAIKDLTLLELCGREIGDKVKWFLDRIGDLP